MLAKVAFFAGAAYFLHVPSELGTAMAIPPDTDEYCISLAHFVEDGRFGYELNGAFYPSKCPPWFSLIYLLPSYLLSGFQILFTSWSVLCLAILALVAIERIGARLGLGSLSILPSLAVLLMPEFIFYSRIAMTEVPYAAVLSLAMLDFLMVSRKERVHVHDAWSYGLLCAALFAIRPSGFCTLIPFFILIFRKSAKTRFRLCVLSVLPTAVFGAATLLYNFWTFGSAFRNGYQYWSPIPFDEPSLLWGWKYVPITLRHLVGQPMFWVDCLMVGIVACWFIMYRMSVFRKRGDADRNGSLADATLFVLYHCAVFGGMYFGYSWPDTRFFLPVSVCLFPVALAVLKFIQPSRFSNQFRFVFSMIVFLLVVFVGHKQHLRYLNNCLLRSKWLVYEQNAANVLPNDVSVLTIADPNRLEYFNGSEKHVMQIPYARNVDYACSMVAEKSIRGKIKIPNIWRWDRFIDMDLVRSGDCRLPFPEVFSENPDIVASVLKQGQRCFLWVPESEGAFMEWIAQVMRPRNVNLRLVSGWDSESIQPNLLRKAFDSFALGTAEMITRPSFRLYLFEFVFSDADSALSGSK